ncbi:unnamed protein product [Rotaria sordida]|uniref:Uncharacterized protein n=1 Tax=Rotaria sordida TaxID=392033 RepID=A0A814VT84_9BILA|nr:unnamed protein product [Rotaria sordida]
MNESGWNVKWFNQAPVDYLGVIVYLARRSELYKLNMSLLSLRRYLRKPRPVVIFHDDDLNDIGIQLALAKTLRSDIPLGFEHIRFPAQTNIAHDHDRYPLGYHHMCQFFAIMLPHHPLLTNMFTYYWRLDSDSHLLGPPLVDDLFDYMNEKRLQYAFVMVEVDASEYVQGLWELFHQFLARLCLKPSMAVKKTQTSFFSGYSYSIFYNNFELSNASMWRDESSIAGWLREVDEAKGIYSHRWGDAPIHTLAVTQFVERDRVVKISDLGYFHRREYVCADEVRSCVVPTHLEASANRPFPRGCHPVTNPLCQYYPEKRGK